MAVSGEVDRRAGEQNAVGRPVEHCVEERAVRGRPIGEPGDLAIAAVEHAGQRDEQGRGDRSPHREAGGRRHGDGEGDERDLVRCDAREEGEQRGCDHPLREGAVEPGGDRAVERLARDSQDVAAAVAVVARRVDIEPPRFVADGQRTGDTRVGQHLDGTGEAGVAGGDRHLDGVEQGRAADEGADVEGVVHRELLADRSDTAVGDANLHGVARIDPRRPTEPCVDRHQDLARLHRRLLEPLQQRGREHVVGHHQGERLIADPVTRRQRREPVALPVPLVAHDRHRDAPAPAHLEHVPVDLVGSMARDHHDLVESRLPGAGEGTLDEADTP